MPITFNRKKPLPTVEALLEKAKAELLPRLRGPLQLPAWVWMVREGILLPNERIEDATPSALFRSAALFCGEPENDKTAYTARRALGGDYTYLMEQIRALQSDKSVKPTESEKEAFTRVYGEPGAL